MKAKLAKIFKECARFFSMLWHFVTGKEHCGHCDCDEESGSEEK